MWIKCHQDAKRANGKAKRYPLNMEHVIFFIYEEDQKQWVAMDIRGMRHVVNSDEEFIIDNLLNAKP